MVVSRETTITKADAAKRVFSSELVGSLLGGCGYSHLTADALALLLMSINNVLCGPALVTFESSGLANSIYNLLYNDGAFLFYPPHRKNRSS